MHSCDLFQAEIITRQNRIMQILTIVTTIFTADAARRVVRHELCRHAGADVEVQLPRRRYREHRDRGHQPVGMQEEKVLVTKTPAERKPSAGAASTRSAKCSGFSIDVSRSGNALLPEVCVGDDPLAGVDHHRHRQQVGTVDRALRHRTPMITPSASPKSSTFTSSVFASLSRERAPPARR